jgi:hypothetical protein
MDDTIQPVGPSKGLVERAKAMILSPKTEWPVVAAESDSVQNVFLKYVVPLAAIGPIASLIGGQVFGYGGFGFSFRLPLSTAIATSITQYVLTLVGIFVVAWVANFLSPKFGGKDSFAAAFKWVAYAYTASWVVGVIGLVPALGILGLLGLYSLYVLYLGATPMMAVPQDKSVGYTVVTVVATIVAYFVVGLLAASLTGMFTPGINAATIASANADQVNVSVPGYGEVKVTDANGTQTVTIPGYGEMKVTDEGGRQTVEIPGMGKVEVTKDGNTTRVQGEGFNAEVQSSSTQ